MKMRKKGFTLIELMIVIAIIAILAAILIPNFMKARAQSQATSCKANVKAVGTANEMYSTDNNGRYAAADVNLTTKVNDTYYLKIYGACPAQAGKVSGPAAAGAGYNYAVATNPDMYKIQCVEVGAASAHKAAYGSKTASGNLKDCIGFNSSVGLYENVTENDTGI